MRKDTKKQESLNKKSLSREEIKRRKQRGIKRPSQNLEKDRIDLFFLQPFFCL